MPADIRKTELFNLVASELLAAGLEPHIIIDRKSDIEKDIEQYLAKPQDSIRNWRKYFQRINVNYGFTKQEWLEMWEHQGFACYLCGYGNANSTVVDHNHKTGKVRAILCGHCNTLLGSYEAGKCPNVSEKWAVKAKDLLNL